MIDLSSMAILLYLPGEKVMYMDANAVSYFLNICPGMILISYSIF